MSIFTPPTPPYKDLVQHKTEKPSYTASTEQSICTPSGREVGPKSLRSSYGAEGRGTRSIMPRSQRKML